MRRTAPLRRGPLARLSPWSTPVLIGLAVAITFAITAGPILLAGANPIVAYGEFVVVPLTSSFTLLEVGVAATPILFTGASVAIAFRAGYWNIGVEGQLLMGAVAAAAVGMVVEGWPAILAITLMIAAGALAGAAWALVPALLRVRLGIDEVVTTLLLNPVALLLVQALVQGPWRDPSGITESPPIAEVAHFPQLLERSRLHLGFLLAVGIAVIAWWVIGRTAAGLRLRAVGLSPHAARFAGIPVERTLLRVALVSGAIAGIAGVSEVAGIQYRLTSGLSPGYGYTGIVVAMLGGLTLPGVLVSAFLIGDLDVGASAAERALDIPSQMAEVVQGTLLLTVVGLLALRRWRTVRAGPPADEPEPASNDARRAEPAPG
jgi:general nucleoside transport system permease protein